MYPLKLIIKKNNIFIIILFKITNNVNNQGTYYFI
uniref:Uncharacterized protein n=1 Tax=viral metagenome TaxID=1070528 RepID=A0A6C0H866_9ZZZZ